MPTGTYYDDSQQLNYDYDPDQNECSFYNQTDYYGLLSTQLGLPYQSSENWQNVFSQIQYGNVFNYEELTLEQYIAQYQQQTTDVTASNPSSLNSSNTSTTNNSDYNQDQSQNLQQPLQDLQRHAKSIPYNKISKILDKLNEEYLKENKNELLKRWQSNKSKNITSQNKKIFSQELGLQICCYSLHNYITITQSKDIKKIFHRFLQINNQEISKKFQQQLMTQEPIIGKEEFNENYGKYVEQFNQISQISCQNLSLYIDSQGENSEYISQLLQKNSDYIKNLLNKKQ